MQFEELIAEAVRQKTSQELRATIEKAARELGFEYVVHARSPKRDALGRPSRVDVLRVTYPQDWVQRYFEKNYAAIDAAVQLAGNRNVPFAWQSIPSMCPLSQSQQTLFSEARDAGLRNGVSVPFHHLDGRFEIISFATTSDEVLPPLVQYQMQTIGSLLALRHQELEKPEQPPSVPILSERERECLTWVAAGKSSWDIARILNISANTVNFHVKNAMLKLDSNNRVFAVVLALRLGLISP